MKHTIKGNLQGMLCKGFSEPLANVQVRLYRPFSASSHQAATGETNGQNFAILSDLAILHKEKRLIAVTQADSRGRFLFDLDDSLQYDGEAIEVDVCCRHVPNQQQDAIGTHSPVQFSLATINPCWRMTDRNRQASWDCIIPDWFWCTIRARFNARVICGRITSRADRMPFHGVRVHALMSSQYRHADLGDAVTDSQGWFRIDYTSNNNASLLLPTWLDHIDMTGQGFTLQVETEEAAFERVDSADHAPTDGPEFSSACYRIDLMTEVDNRRSEKLPDKTVLHMTDYTKNEDTQINPIPESLSPSLLPLSVP